MPRVAKIWQRSEDGWYYCKHKGKQVKLSQNKKQAETAFHVLKSEVEDVRPVRLTVLPSKWNELFR
jgi:hypothetical protein